MRDNHIPVHIRLKKRIGKLLYLLEENHIPSPTKGNPYYCCAKCGIYDPQLSVKGRHHHNCPIQGIDKQIFHYKKLLSSVLNNKQEGCGLRCQK